MPHVTRRWWWIVIAAPLFLSLAFSEERSRNLPPALTSATDEAELRSLVEKFFAAYTHKDLDGFMALWSAQSPDFAPRRKLMMKLFSTHDHFQLKSLAFNRTALQGKEASVRVSVELHADEVKTGARAAGFGKMTRVLSFLREEGGWKVWRESSAEEALAALLVAAKTNEERSALLTAEKELVTAALWETLSAQGERMALSGDYQEAAISYRLARETAEQLDDKRGQAVALLGLGLVQRMEGNYARALEYGRASLTLNEELGNKAGIASALSELGSINIAQGQAARALEFHQQSLALREALGDRTGIATSLNNIGICQRMLGNYALAIEYYQKSLALAEALENRLQQARALNNLGAAHSAIGNYHEALAFYRLSLPINEELENRAGIANTTVNIGLSNRLLGNYDVALEYCLKGLRLSEAIGDQRGVAQALRAIAQTYSIRGDRTLALEYFEKALRLQEVKGDKGETAVVLGSIGGIHQSLGHTDLALEYYRRSLAIREAIGDRSGVAAIHQNLGGFYWQQGRYELALEHYQKCLALREALGGKLGIAEALQKIASFYNARGEHGQALAVASRAATISAEIGHRETLWQALTVAGKAYRALKQPAEARKAFVEAIAVVESLRAQVGGGEREQQRFFENKLSPYHAMVDLLFEQHRVDEALAYVEAAKARVLLDVLQSGRVNISKAMTLREQEQERRLKGELVSLNTQLTRQSTSTPASDGAAVANLNTRLRQARLDYEAFQSNLYATHPELKTQRGEAQPITPGQTEELLAGNRNVLLNYLVTDSKTYLLVLTKRERQAKVDLQAYEIEIKREDLGAQVERFRNLLAQRNPDFAEAAGQLYNLLLGPARPQLEGKTNLVIVPDGPLWNLPFQALQPAQAHYLIEDHAVTYAPSLTVLREMVKLRKRGGDDRSPPPPTLLAFGNPALGQRTDAARDGQFAPLPEAEREVKALEQLYGPAQSRVYTGAEAREDRAKSEAGRYRIIHLATHGSLSDASPMYSHLLLAPGAGNEKEDGLLEAWELLDLNLRAELVVLSACDTARGHIGAGEGMIGLSWALFVAGTPTTVVSQWKVASASTAQLMVEFHRNLKAELRAKSKPSEAEALRQAILLLQRDEHYRHPFYWAGFLVMGDGF